MCNTRLIIVDLDTGVECIKDTDTWMSKEKEDAIQAKYLADLTAKFSAMVDDAIQRELQIDAIGDSDDGS